MDRSSSSHTHPESVRSEKSSRALYHVEGSKPDGSRERVERFLAAFGAILKYSNYRFLLDLYSRTSSKCGRCAVTCQVFQATGDARDVPC
jgi:hypothetical protein